MTNRTTVRVILIAIAIFAALYFLYLIQNVLGMLFIAVFLAIALGPIVEGLVRHKIKRSLAILLTYLMLLGLVFGLGLLVVPPIVSGVNDFTGNVPGYVRDLRNSKTFRRYDDKYKITPKLEQQATKLPSHLSDAASGLRTVTVGVFGTIVQLVTILVMAFFLLLDGRRILGFMFRELGPERGERLASISEDVYGAVGGYVAGNGLISVTTALTSYIVMSILGL